MGGFVGVCGAWVDGMGETHSAESTGPVVYAHQVPHPHTWFLYV